jgi:hypothetical protein
MRILELLLRDPGGGSRAQNEPVVDAMPQAMAAQPNSLLRRALVGQGSTA